MNKPRIRVAIAVTVVAVVAITVAACGSSSSKSSSTSTGATSTGGSGPTVALLLPENQTARYETHDRPDFAAKLKQVCTTCTLLYSNATQDATKQQSQADAALTQGAKVLVLDPVDAGSAVAIVGQGQRPQGSGDQLRPADQQRRRSLLRLVRQRPRGHAPGVEPRRQAQGRWASRPARSS